MSDKPDIHSRYCPQCKRINPFVFTGYCLREFGWWHHLLVKLHIRKSKIEIGKTYSCLYCSGYKFVSGINEGLPNVK